MQKSVLFVLCIIALSAVVEAKPSPCGGWWCGGSRTVNNVGNGWGNRNTVFMKPNGGGCGNGFCGGYRENNVGNGNNNYNVVYGLLTR